MGPDEPAVTGKRVSNWSAPNIITVVRMLFAPGFIWLLLLGTNSPDSAARWVALGLFIVGMATDGIDGYVARRFDLVTNLGKILDPIADKVLIGGALIGLSLLGELPWWVTGIILLREIGVTVFRLAVLSDRVIPASRGGKLKTVSQFVALTLALAPLSVVWAPTMDIVNIVLMTWVVIITWLTGLDYLVDGIRQQRALRREEAV